MLMAILRTVVQPGCSLDEHVLYVREFRDVCPGSGIAAQLVRNNLARHRVRVQHLDKSTPACKQRKVLIEGYGFMKANRARWPIATMAGLVQVSARCRRPPHTPFHV